MTFRPSVVSPSSVLSKVKSALVSGSINSKRHTCTEGGNVELLLVDQSLGEDEKVFKMVVMAA